MNMIGFSFIELLMLNLLGGSPLGVPLSLPPLPEDPVMAQVAPEECLWYLSWSGCAKADPASKNHTEQLLAEQEVQRFTHELEMRLRDAIKRGVYVIAGVTPIVTAGELADLVRAQIPGAQIAFNPDRELQPILDRLLLPPDDRNAQQEWGWEAAYTQADVIDDFLRELRDHPQRYA